MKNITTPRTLAECQFTLGHAAVQHAAHRHTSPAERIAGVLLAVVIGIGLATMTLHYWAKGW